MRRGCVRGWSLDGNGPVIRLFEIAGWLEDFCGAEQRMARQAALLAGRPRPGGGFEMGASREIKPKVRRASCLRGR